MRRSMLLVPVLILLPAACRSGGSPPLSEGEVTAIREEVAEAVVGLTEAMNSHDSDRVFAFYRQDEEFFYLGCTSAMMGWSTFSPRIASYYRGADEVTFEREIITIQVLSAEVAVVAMRGRSTEAPALFWTEVLQKSSDGEWLITSEHESWPDCSLPRGPHLGTEGDEAMRSPEPGGH